VFFDLGLGWLIDGLYLTTLVGKGHARYSVKRGVL
jgi:hypothetical protein